MKTQVETVPTESKTLKAKKEFKNGVLIPGEMIFNGKMIEMFTLKKTVNFIGKSGKQLQLCLNKSIAEFLVDFPELEFINQAIKTHLTRQGSRAYYLTFKRKENGLV